MGNEPDKTGKLGLVDQAAKKFEVSFYPRRIYFPKSTYDKINDFQNNLVQIANDFTHWQERQKRREQYGEQNEDDDIHYWSKLFEKFKNESKPLFDEVHSEFQRLIGVRDLPASTAIAKTDAK